jgi:lysophospholipase L1-like esterase
MIFINISRREYSSRLIFACSIFIAGLLTLLGLEWYLKTSTTPSLTLGYKRSHSERIYELVPNYEGKTYDAILKFNSLGIRDYERPILKDAYRIGIFGDSITFGQGVELKNTFAKILELQLNEHYKTKPQIQVFNFGVPSYNTINEYIYLKDSYQKYKPDLVILQYTAEDDSISSHKKQYKFISFIKDIAQQFYIYQFLVSNIYSLMDYSTDHKSSNIYSNDNEGWLETQKAFKDIKQFAEENNFQLLFALYVNKYKDPIVRKIKNAVKNAQIDNVVLIDNFFHEVKEKEQLLWLKSDDHHFSKLAHQLTAKGIYQYLIDKEITNHGKKINSISD